MDGFLMISGFLSIVGFCFLFVCYFLKSDEKLFQVPKKCMITWRTSSLRRRMPKLKLPGWNRLILAMMFENSLSDSFWRPYLDILPASLNTPVFWTDDQLKHLSGCSIEDQIGSKKIFSDFNKFIVPILSKSELYPKGKLSSTIRDQFFNFDQYRRFGSIIMAYSFSDDDGEIAMVPMADMLNHKTGHNNARLYFDQEDGSIHQKKENGDGKDDDEKVVSAVPHSSNGMEIPLKDTHHDQHDHNHSSSKNISNIPSNSSSNIEIDPSLQHLIPPSKKPKKSEKNFLHMRSRRVIDPEEELFNTYGNLPDSELLRKYGYCEELGINRWNDIYIPVSFVISHASSSSGWGPIETAKRKKFMKSHNLVDFDASIIFHLHQDSFGPFDPLDIDDANEAQDDENDGNDDNDGNHMEDHSSSLLNQIKGGIPKDFLSLVKIFAASPNDWIIAEKAILDSISKRSVKKDDENDQDDNDNDDNDENDENGDKDEKVEKDESQNIGAYKDHHDHHHHHHHHQPKPKKGGDLIPINNTELLSKIMSSIFQAKIDSYGPDALSSSLQLLSKMPQQLSSSHDEILPDTIRTRCALIVKIGELQLLESLKAEASSYRHHLHHKN